MNLRENKAISIAIITFIILDSRWPQPLVEGLDGLEQDLSTLSIPQTDTSEESGGTQIAWILQPKNTLSPQRNSVLGPEYDKCVRLLQPSNALVFMLDRFEGRVKDFRLVQLQNVYFPISLIPSRSVTDFRFLQLANAWFEIMEACRDMCEKGQKLFIDYSYSQTTLEEVFFNFARLKENYDSNEDSIGDSPII